MNFKSAFVGNCQTITPLGLTVEENVDNILKGKCAYKAPPAGHFSKDFKMSAVGLFTDELFENRKSWNLTRSEILLDLLLKSFIKENKIKPNKMIVLYKNFNPFEFFKLSGKMFLNDRESIHNLCKKNNLNIEIEDIYTVDNTCTTGLSLIATAAEGIQLNRWENVLICTIDTMEIKETYSLSSLGAFSHGFLDATESSRPFDKNRNGFVKTESASLAFVTSNKSNLNNQELFEIKSFCQTNDAFRITDGRDDGKYIRFAMEQSIERANVSINDLAFVKAHGTGTKLNDQHEAEAIIKTFGSELAVTSLKGHLGHTTDASGLVETIIAASALKNRSIVLPTRNCLDLEYSINLIRGRGYETSKKIFLSNSFGFGGNNISAIIGVGP